MHTIHDVEAPLSRHGGPLDLRTRGREEVGVEVVRRGGAGVSFRGGHGEGMLKADRSWEQARVHAVEKR